MMRKILTAVFIIAFGFLGMSCSNSPEPIISETIGQGAISPSMEVTIQPGNFVIENSRDWWKLLVKIDHINDESSAFSEIDIDFSKWKVIAVFDQVRKSGGYSIDVVDVQETKKRLEVIIDQIHKGSIISIVQQPFHIVKVSRNNKEIYFNRLF